MFPFQEEKKAKIRNRYNQAPYLIRNSIWKSEKNTRRESEKPREGKVKKHVKTQHIREPRGQLFPSR